jgi:hypothetical protein
MYDLRHAENDWGQPITIEKHVWINFFGVIFTDMPIPFRTNEKSVALSRLNKEAIEGHVMHFADLLPYISKADKRDLKPKTKTEIWIEIIMGLFLLMGSIGAIYFAYKPFKENILNWKDPSFIMNCIFIVLFCVFFGYYGIALSIHGIRNLIQFKKEQKATESSDGQSYYQYENKKRYAEAYCSEVTLAQQEYTQWCLNDPNPNKMKQKQCKANMKIINKRIKKCKEGDKQL